MKRLITTVAIAGSLAVAQTAIPTMASAASPVFGTAKISALSNNAAKQVTAKGGTTAYYLYLGLSSASSAIYYAGLAQYYNYYNYNGPSGSATTYSYTAYTNAQQSANNFYSAYYYSYYGL